MRPRPAGCTSGCPSASPSPPFASLSAADQWTVLARDPSRVPAAVEEILRTSGKGGGGIPRYAQQNVQIGGVDIAAGELVIFDIGAANHDPAAFADSPGDVLDHAILRTDVGQIRDL